MCGMTWHVVGEVLYNCSSSPAVAACTSIKGKCWFTLCQHKSTKQDKMPQNDWSFSTLQDTQGVISTVVREWHTNSFHEDFCVRLLLSAVLKWSTSPHKLRMGQLNNLNSIISHCYNITALSGAYPLAKPLSPHLAAHAHDFYTAVPQH